MNKHFKEVITHSALDFKLAGCPGVLLEHSEAEAEPQFKNVCAPIPLELNAEFESITNLLNISKRQFLVLALSSAIDDAKQVIEEIDVFEHVKPADLTGLGAIHVLDRDSVIGEPLDEEGVKARIAVHYSEQKAVEGAH